jgi:hypothetical protein
VNNNKFFKVSPLPSAPIQAPQLPKFPLREIYGS